MVVVFNPNLNAVGRAQPPSSLQALPVPIEAMLKPALLTGVCFCLAPKAAQRGGPWIVNPVPAHHRHLHWSQYCLSCHFPETVRNGFPPILVLYERAVTTAY